MGIRIPLITPTSRLYPATCANAACERELVSGDGILTLTNSREFRYCDSVCGAEGYAVHRALTAVGPALERASDHWRDCLELEIMEKLQAHELYAEVDWTTGKSVKLRRLGEPT